MRLRLGGRDLGFVEPTWWIGHWRRARVRLDIFSSFRRRTRAMILADLKERIACARIGTVDKFQTGMQPIVDFISYDHRTHARYKRPRGN